MNDALLKANAEIERLRALNSELLAACKERLHSDDCNCAACAPLQIVIAKAEGK